MPPLPPFSLNADEGMVKKKRCLLFNTIDLQIQSDSFTFLLGLLFFSLSAGGFVFSSTAENAPLLLVT